MSNAKIVQFYDARVKLMIGKMINGYIDILAINAKFTKEERELMIENSVIYWERRNKNIGEKVGGECMNIQTKTEEDRKLLDRFVLETNSSHLKDVVLIQIINGIDRYRKRTGLSV